MTDTPAVTPLTRRNLVNPIHVWTGPTWEIRARRGDVVSLILNGAANSSLRALSAHTLLDALAEAVAVAETDADEVAG
jgi:hypothetical protein